MGEGEGADPSKLTLWARRRHSTDRRSLHCLWQFTPQAGGGRWRGEGVGSWRGPPDQGHGSEHPHPHLQACTSPQFLLLPSSCPTKIRIPFQSLLFILLASPCPLQSARFPGQLSHQNKSPLDGYPPFNIITVPLGLRSSSMLLKCPTQVRITTQGVTLPPKFSPPAPLTSAFEALFVDAQDLK